MIFSEQTFADKDKDRDSKITKKPAKSTVLPISVMSFFDQI